MIYRERSFDLNDFSTPGREAFDRVLKLRQLRHAHERREKRVPTVTVRNPELPVDERLETVSMDLRDYDRMVQANLELRQLPMKKPHKLMPRGNRDVDCLIELTLADRLWLKEIGIPFVYPEKDPGEDGWESLAEL